MGSRLPGIAHRSPWAASAFGRTPRAPNTTTIYAPSTAGLSSAGEHASYLPAWQEGAVTSALDAIERMHQRALAAGAAA